MVETLWSAKSLEARSLQLKQTLVLRARSFWCSAKVRILKLPFFGARPELKFIRPPTIGGRGPINSCSSHMDGVVGQ